MPSDAPHLGPMLLMLGAVALLLLSVVLSLFRLRRPTNTLRLAAKSSQYWAVGLGLAALIWHGLSHRSLLPSGDNFESLGAVGLLLVGFVLYVQGVRPIPALDLFLLPPAVLMLLCAVIFGRIKPNAYHPENLWAWMHPLCSYGGALAFAIAAAGGCMYLILAARLRKKSPPGGPDLGSLERLERVNHSAAALGFALLTLGMVTGLMIIHRGAPTRLGPHWLASPKVLLAFSVWIVYALALHTPISPALRGRKSAMLSILGFALMFGTIIAVQFMPGSP
ncbi:MAG: cytochrome c biogenesis protein CcsA [Tepidisphaeraceae bacterium]